MYDKIEKAKSSGSFDEKDLASLDAGKVDVIFEGEIDAFTAESQDLPLIFFK